MTLWAFLSHLADAHPFLFLFGGLGVVLVANIVVEMIHGHPPKTDSVASRRAEREAIAEWLRGRHGADLAQQIELGEHLK
jgi:hypothetical protein